MKVCYAIDPNTKVEIDLSDLKKVFQFRALAETMFGVKKCGNCESPNLSPSFKTPGGYEYYSIRCNDCHHEFKFGQQKETGQLFPKGWEPPFKRDDDGDDVDQTDNRDNRDEREEPRQQRQPAGRAARSDGIDF